MLVLFFQIQEIEIRVDEDEEQGEKKSAKEALVMWCQRNTRGYKDVHVRVRNLHFKMVCLKYSEIILSHKD